MSAVKAFGIYVMGFLWHHLHFPQKHLNMLDKGEARGAVVLIKLCSELVMWRHAVFAAPTLPALGWGCRLLLQTHMITKAACK